MAALKAHSGRGDIAYITWAFFNRTVYVQSRSSHLTVTVHSLQYHAMVHSLCVVEDRSGGKAESVE